MDELEEAVLDELWGKRKKTLEVYWYSMYDLWGHELSLKIAAKETGRSLESVRREVEASIRNKNE